MVRVKARALALVLILCLLLGVWALSGVGLYFFNLWSLEHMWFGITYKGVNVLTILLGIGIVMSTPMWFIWADWDNKEKQGKKEWEEIDTIPIGTIYSFDVHRFIPSLFRREGLVHRIIISLLSWLKLMFLVIFFQYLGWYTAEVIHFTTLLVTAFPDFVVQGRWLAIHLFTALISLLTALVVYWRD